GRAALLAAARPVPPAAVGEDELAVIFYTSGTTGRAKGVMLTHGNLMFATRGGLRQTAWMGPPPPLLALMVMPLANTSGHQALLFSIVRGTTVIVLDRFDARAMLDIVEGHRVNMLSGTPTMFRLLWEAGAAERDLSSIVSFGGGGDYFHQDLIDRFRALPRGADSPVFFVTGYGMTETAGQVTQAFPAPEVDGDLGVVQPEIDYRIVDPDGQPVRPGEVGELEVRGANVTPGYWRAPEATAAAFHDGWLRTGDMVREGAEPRRLCFAGRAKDVVVSGGNTIYPPEIERALLEHPAVARAVVLGVPDERMGEVVVAAVEPHAGAVVDEGALLAWIGERVAPYQRPRAGDGTTLTLSGTTPAEAGGNRCSGGTNHHNACTANADCPGGACKFLRCTNPGCLFGPPLPIPASAHNAAAISTCVINTVSQNASGTADCGTGTTTSYSIPLSSAVFLTSDLMLMRCSGGSNPGGDCTGGGGCG